METNNKMPFSLSKDEFERIKADCIRRIREEAGRTPVVTFHRHIVEYAAVAAVIIGIAIVSYVGIGTRTPMDKFISHLNSAPSEVIDEMCSDVSDYNEDYTNLL